MGEILSQKLNFKQDPLYQNVKNVSIIRRGSVVERRNRFFGLGQTVDEHRSRFFRRRLRKLPLDLLAEIMDECLKAVQFTQKITDRAYGHKHVPHLARAKVEFLEARINELIDLF